MLEHIKIVLIAIQIININIFIGLNWFSTPCTSGKGKQIIRFTVPSLNRKNFSTIPKLPCPQHDNFHYRRKVVIKSIEGRAFIEYFSLQRKITKNLFYVFWCRFIAKLLGRSYREELWYIIYMIFHILLKKKQTVWIYTTKYMLQLSRSEKWILKRAGSEEFFLSLEEFFFWISVIDSTNKK